MDILRTFIRNVLLEVSASDSEVHQKDEELLTEPDDNDGKEREDEASFGGVPGVATPLGTGSTYPDEPKKKRKSKKHVRLK